jgi:hypothetical protein
LADAAFSHMLAVEVPVLLSDFAQESDKLFKFCRTELFEARRKLAEWRTMETLIALRIRSSMKIAIKIIEATLIDLGGTDCRNGNSTIGTVTAHRALS